MLIFEYKVDGTKQQDAAIDEAIRIVQFMRNKCLRKWMDERAVSKNDLQCYCATLAKAYPWESSSGLMWDSKPTIRTLRAIRSTIRGIIAKLRRS